MISQEILDSLNPRLAKQLSFANDVVVEKQQTPSVGLNAELRGGLAYGRQVLLWGNKSSGKAQPVDTIVPSPDGDKRLGDINVGDYVYGGDGKPTKVVAVWPQGTIDNYEVAFSDNTISYCNEQHLWAVQTRKQKYGAGRNGLPLKGNYRAITLKEIAQSDIIGQHKTTYNFFLPKQPVIHFSKNDLPMDPYLLGLLLGDGSFRNSCDLTCCDDEIIEIVKSRQDKFAIAARKVFDGVPHFSIIGGRKVIKELGLWNLYSHEKYIPAAYMYSSYEDRIALLRGLMDSDGSASNELTRAHFYTTSLQLANDVASLVRSLGGVARLDKPDTRNERKPVYSLSISTDFNPFSLSRKADRYRVKEWFRAIKSVKKIGVAEMVCITVENTDGLYLTNDYIVTHNSSFCLQMIGKAQQDGRTCAWLDSESSFDPNWASRLGVDNEQLIYSQAKKINDMVDISQQLMHAGIDIIVVDSISALLPAIFFDDKEALKDLSDTKQIGSDARDMAHAVKMLNYANENTLLILISQHRNKIGRMFTQLAPTGGEATKFFSSTIVRLWSSESDGQAIKQPVYNGDKAIERKVGRKVTWTVDFNKTGPAFGAGEYDFYFDGDMVGVDTVGELLDIAIARGLVEKGGAWLKYAGNQWQGRSNAIKALRADDELCDTLLKELA